MKEAWNERYKNEYIYGKQPNDFLVSQISICSKGKVFCLAEGQGRNAVYLAKLGYDVTAVDFSETGLKKALLLAEESKIHIDTWLLDLNDLKLEPCSLDGVVSIFMHLPEKTRKHVHQEVLNALKKNAFYLMEVYSKEQLMYNTGGPRSEDLLYSLNDILNDFKNQMVFKIKTKKIRDVAEGTFHLGKASVIQIYGVKK